MPLTLIDSGLMVARYALGSNAGFFLWVDLRPFLPPHKPDYKSGWDREDALMQNLFKHKVFITNGKDLGAEEPGWFRVIFSQDEAVIREGLRRVGEVIGTKLPIR